MMTELAEDRPKVPKPPRLSHLVAVGPNFNVMG